MSIIKYFLQKKEKKELAKNLLTRIKNLTEKELNNLKIDKWNSVYSLWINGTYLKIKWNGTIEIEDDIIYSPPFNNFYTL